MKGSLDLPDVYSKNLDDKPMGSASIAEVHRTKDQFGSDVILKLVRPMYVYYYINECDFLLNDVWPALGLSKDHSPNTISQARELLNYLVRNFIGEFDIIIIYSLHAPRLVRMRGEQFLLTISNTRKWQFLKNANDELGVPKATEEHLEQIVESL